MKRFVKFIFLYYLLPLLVIAVIILPVSLRKYTITEEDLAHTYQNDLNSYNWVNKVDSVKGFILGSSTLRYGLSSALLKNNDSNWINFSMDARDPIALYLLLKKYLPLKRPTYVLVGLDPWIYSKKYYMHLNKLMYSDLDASETYNMLSLDKSVILEKFKLNALFIKKISDSGPKINTMDTASTEIPPDYGSVKLTRRAVNFNDANADWFELNKLHWSEMEFDYLQRIKDICHQQCVKLIFVIPPKRSDYVSAVRTHFSNESKEWWTKINKIIGGEEIIGTYDALSGYDQN